MVPASRTKAHRDYTDFGSWQRKPVETGRHSLGDSLLQVGVHGGKREGVPQPGGTDRRRNAGPPRSPGNPPPFGAPSWDAAPPIRPRGPRCAPSLETPPRPAARNGGTRGGRGKRGLRAGGRAQPGGGLAPGPKGLPPGRPPLPYAGPPADRPGSRRAHRLHGGGHVVVALRLLGQPRPLQQLLAVPHVAEPGLASRSARSPARPLRSPRRPPPRTRTGLPAGRGCRQQAAPLALSLARPALCGSRRGRRRGRTGGRAGGDGRTGGRLRSGSCRAGRRGAARVGGGEGRPGPNGLFQGDVTFYK